MLTIDVNEMHISMTRSDSATIEFSAKEGTETYLAQAGDVLTFGVSKKYGGDKTKPSGFKIINRFNDKFKSAGTITSEEFNAAKTSYFRESGGVYTRCASTDSWISPGTGYYINEMWNIEITPDDMTTFNEDGSINTEKTLKFGDYYWDLQLTVNEGEDAYTIIGKCDDLEPKLTIWGEIV